jgi:6-pyruvoyltetrahydropterin/6-carboxytetrahydropterin synthase
MIQLTREVRLTLDPLDGGTGVSAHANSWSGFGASERMAPFHCWRVTLEGTPHPVSGYLCDIKVIDDIVLAAVKKVRPRLDPAEATEAEILAQVWDALPREFVTGACLLRPELLPSPYCRFTLERENPDMIEYTEQFEFSAAHRLHCAGWSDEQNRSVFGKCNNPSGHGHNYVFEVSVRVPRASWDFAHRRHLMRVVKEAVLDRFDHKHLNEDTAEFRDLNPTVENITHVIWDQLCEPVKPLELVEVKLLETAKTWARYRGE